MNYGDLIAPPLPLPDATLTALDGQAFNLKSLRGKWTFVHFGDAACATACRDKLYKMRQVRLTQGKNMERVQRLWLINGSGAVDQNVLREYAGTVTVRVEKQDLPALLKAFLPASSIEDHIWLVDPLGNVMLRYPPAADPSRMKNDLSRLLRVSRIE